MKNFHKRKHIPWLSHSKMFTSLGSWTCKCYKLHCPLLDNTQRCSFYYDVRICWRSRYTVKFAGFSLCVARWWVHWNKCTGSWTGTGKFWIHIIRLDCRHRHFCESSTTWSRELYMPQPSGQSGHHRHFDFATATLPIHPWCQFNKQKDSNRKLNCLSHSNSFFLQQLMLGNPGVEIPAKKMKSN